MPIKESGVMPGTAYLIDGDGKAYPFDRIQSITLSTSEEDSKSATIAQLKPVEEFSATLKMRRMSRKRFVKKLRRAGWTKKESKIIARETKIPYAMAWLHCAFGGLMIETEA